VEADVSQRPAPRLGQPPRGYVVARLDQRRGGGGGAGSTAAVTAAAALGSTAIKSILRQSRNRGIKIILLGRGMELYRSPLTKGVRGDLNPMVEAPWNPPTPLFKGGDQTSSIKYFKKSTNRTGCPTYGKIARER